MTSWLSRLRRWRRPATFADMDTAPLSSESSKATLVTSADVCSR